jgi:RNA polymerase sigma factor (sigma-70 family)
MATKAESLKLNDAQQSELDRVWHLIKSIAASYYINDLCVSVDDLIQESAIRVIRAIKHHITDGYSESERDGYYVTTIHRACLNCIRDYNKYYSRTTSLDCVPTAITCDEDRLHRSLYVQSLLDSVQDIKNKSILLHYYGIGTQPLIFSDISPLLGIAAPDVTRRHNRTISRIKHRIDKGDTPSWTTTN